MNIMKQQVFNPFLPIDTYIPDGEPHVFGDRVYLFGSHDKEGGEMYCMLDYEFWSAPVNDLSDWSSKGVNYSSSQDPLSKKSNRRYMYAPDCVRGNDGKYYLYYCLSGDNGVGCYYGPISVAVCDTPDGKYQFYGYVKFPDGTLCKKYVPFDPAVINDNGTIRLYYGTCYPFDELPKISQPIMHKMQSKMFDKTVKEIKAEKGGVMGAIACELEDDMLTIKTIPKRILPTKTKGTPFESRVNIFKKDGHSLSGHGFYEGSSIRKINNKYYFIYSSVNNHELCYATSDFPDKNFEYGGVIVSNGDVGYNNRKEKDRLNHTGTTHGSIEKINGAWYVFYHRQTHGTDYSRQACAEKIDILPDGTILQTEITSCGLNDGDLLGKGEYPAVICCNLTNGRMPHGGNKSFKNLPKITSGNGERYLTNLKANTIVTYKYFDLSETKSISIKARGNGVITVLSKDKQYGDLSVNSEYWNDFSGCLTGVKHSDLTFKIKSGNLEILSFELLN